MCTEQLSDSPEVYLWMGIDMGSNAGFCATIGVGVDMDFSFEITTGICITGVPDHDVDFAKEVTIANTGVPLFMSAIMEAGVSAEVLNFDLEESLRQKAVREYDAGMARLAADGRDAAKFAAAADKVFKREHGRAIAEEEKPAAYREFAEKLDTARDKKQAADTKAVAPDFFWGDPLICKQYPFCGDPPGVSGESGDTVCPSGLAKIEVRIPVDATVDAYGEGGITVRDPIVTSSYGSMDVEFSANVGATAEAASVASAGVEAKLTTKCDVSDCSDPSGEICAFAELKFPELTLPSFEMCGNEIGFDFDLPGVGAELCFPKGQ